MYFCVEKNAFRMPNKGYFLRHLTSIMIFRFAFMIPKATLERLMHPKMAPPEWIAPENTSLEPVK